MKNKEFYKDKIYEVACKRDVFAVNKKTGKVTNCRNLKCSDCLFDKTHVGGCYERAMEWLEQEHNEPVLNDVEKRYLEAVLMPFKDRVLYVEKAIYDDDRAFLRIRIKSILGGDGRESILLPYFHPQKMYVRMEENRRYTIEELGLFTDEE